MDMNQELLVNGRGVVFELKPDRKSFTMLVTSANITSIFIYDPMLNSQNTLVSSKNPLILACPFEVLFYGICGFYKNLRRCRNEKEQDAKLDRLLDENPSARELQIAWKRFKHAVDSLPHQAAVKPVATCAVDVVRDASDF